MIKKRNENFWNLLVKLDQRIIAFLVNNPINIFYLSGFTGEGLLLLTEKTNYLITDPRYTEQAFQECCQCEIIIQSIDQEDGQTNELVLLLKKLEVTRMGIESDSLKVSSYLKYLTEIPGLEMIPLSNLIEKLRRVKDSNEIDYLIKSSLIATQSFRQIIQDIADGISEIDLSAQLNHRLRQNGAIKESFDLIVTSGERTTLIHGKPSEKVIKKNEFILIDFGCIYHMYHSDCTRTLLIGNTNQEQQKIYDLIKKVQEKTLDQIEPGKRCCDLDLFARNLIGENGYGKYFQHSLGHGVGLDIHEMPRLSPNDQTLLEPGMVVTIEPGIYIPGIGGVRIEDTVLITETGYKNLTLLPKELNPELYVG